ncbi:MAG: DUF4911 domain-containing protein [Desulfatiglandales bacterium]|jgi:hypothetical protein|nr:DUF4911 domain-containing protein [Desulfatiglandales bacterium]
METIKHLFRVDRREMNYLRVTIESYDGMAVVRTIDSGEGLIEIQISPFCENLVFDLLNSLVEEEGIRLEKIVDIG